MPRGDGTGPRGRGPVTGRRAGYCAGYDRPGYANPAFGRMGLRRGGRGWRHMYYATGVPGWARARMGYPVWGEGAASYPHVPELTPEREAEVLKNQAQMMQEEIDAINGRIKDLEKLTAEKKK